MISLNAARRVNVDRMDPQRMAGLRRQMIAELRRRLNSVRKAVVQLVRDEDAFGIVANELTYNLASTQVDLPSLLPSIKAMQSRLSPADVVKLEDRPHVTVRYGLAQERAKPVQDLLAGTGPVRFVVGRLGSFSNDEDVLYLSVDSADLLELHETLGQLANETRYGYTPHVTVAYLKKGTARKYLSLRNPAEGREFETRTITFSDSDRKASRVTLNCGGKGGTPGPCPSPGIAKRLAQATVRKAKEMHAKFTERYGTKGAAAMMGAIAITLPIPGNILGVVGIAEGVRGVSRLLRKPQAVTNASLDEMLAEVIRHVKEIHQAAGQPEPVIDEDVIRSHLRKAMAGQPVTNRRWQFMATSEQLKAFQTWVAKQLRSQVLGQTEDALWHRFSKEGWKKGAGRAWDDARQAKLRREQPELFTPDRQDSVQDFYRGSREEFLRSAFNRPVSVERVKQLASRVFTDIKDVTDRLATRLSRTLMDGLTAGRHSKDVAKDLAEEFDWASPKAEAVARTELSRAHSEGQLDALEDMGVAELGVMVEWATAGDTEVCPKCRPLEGMVVKIEEARGLLPLHPNCRCAWVPAGVGEDQEGQKRGKRARKALETINAAWRGGSKLVSGDWLARLLPLRDQEFRQVLINCGGEGGKPGPCPLAVQKFVGKTVGYAEHAQSAKVEAEIAGYLGGQQLDDNEPLDVRILGDDGNEQAVEVKSLLKGSKQAISVHPDALARKVEYQEKNPNATFHTVVVDERETYQGGEHADGFSGNRMYYKRGSGRYSLSKMHPVNSPDELKQLIAAKDDALPKVAKGSLPTGKAAKLLKKQAKAVHESRLKKDRARKARLKAEGKSAYERQT